MLRRRHKNFLGLRGQLTNQLYCIVVLYCTVLYITCLSTLPADIALRLIITIPWTNFLEPLDCCLSSLLYLVQLPSKQAIMHQEVGDPVPPNTDHVSRCPAWSPA